MQVTCGCGQAFTIHAERFPHDVHCHVCGVRFMAHADGSTAEIHAKSLTVSCQCGRQFVINAVQFPQQLYCVPCQRHFTVLDTGETIELAGKAEAPSEEEIPIGNADDRIVDRTAHPVNLQLYDELEFIDAQWRRDHSLYALVRVADVPIMPTRFLSVVVGLGGVGLCVTLMIITVNVLGPVRGIALATVWIAFGLISKILALYIRSEALGLEQAELSWRQRRRELMIRWANAPTNTLPMEDGSFRGVRGSL